MFLWTQENVNLYIIDDQADAFRILQINYLKSSIKCFWPKVQLNVTTFFMLIAFSLCT